MTLSAAIDDTPGMKESKVSVACCTMLFGAVILLVMGIKARKRGPKAATRRPDGFSLGRGELMCGVRGEEEGGGGRRMGWGTYMPSAREEGMFGE